MLRKLMKLKKSNKLLFWLLVPFIALVAIGGVAVKIFMMFNISQSKKELKKTEVKDGKLEEEQKAIKNDSDRLRAEALELKKKADVLINSPEPEDKDENWHKK